jgi:hypothetical protein
MRAVLISGLVLVVTVLWIVIAAEEQHAVTGWLGGIALGVGIVLTAFGFRKS